MNKPAPCPFCGGDDPLADIRDFPNGAAIVCGVCGARGPAVTRDTEESVINVIPNAIEAWNKSTKTKEGQ